MQGSPAHDDDEDDTEDCGGFEDEPLFDKAQCRTLKALAGYGPGCQISDPDYGDEEAGEPQEGYAAAHTGLDQTRSIGPDNPVML